MTRKLLNFKLILRIIISLFVIVNMARSCAKAVTIEEFLEYNNLIEEKIETVYGSNEGLLATCRAIKNNSTSVENAITKNYLGIVGIGDNTSYDIRILCFNSLNNFSVNTNGSLNLGSNNRDAMYRLRQNGSWHLSSLGQNSNGNSQQYCFGIIDMESTNGYNDNCLVNVEFNANPLYFGHLFSSEVTIDGNSYEAIELNYNYRITPVENVLGFEGYSSISAKLDTIVLEVQDLGDYLTLKCTNSTQLNYNQVYLLHVDASIEGNLYELEEEIIFVKPGTIISSGSIVSTPSGDFSFNTENATNQIIENQNQNNNEIIQSINDIVGNLPGLSSGDSSGDVSGDLSSGFDGGGGILGGIFSLFVPDGQFFKEYFEDLNNWFSDRLGLVYFPIELTIDFLQRILTIDFSSQVLTIGPYTMPLQDDFELVPEIQIDFQSFLEDETVNSIHEVYLFITDGLIIFGLYNLILKKYNNIIKNKGG